MECYSIKGLTFFYPEQSVPALSNLSLSIEAGDFFVLFGPSGCGKSTLLRLLKTEISPVGQRSGTVSFLGRTLTDIDRREQVERIGFVSQSPENQIVCDKVWHELAFGPESIGTPQEVIRARVAEMSAFFGIEDWFYRDVRELSGGQKQLLALASVMVMNPDVLILDEPTAQLDPIAASQLIGMLGKINRELGVTVILSEHRLEDVFPFANRCALMDTGTVRFCGAPRELGSVLTGGMHDPFLRTALAGVPAAMRLWAKLDSENTPLPLCVKDGCRFLETYASAHEYREIPACNPSPSGDAVLQANKVWFRYERNAPDILKGVSLTLRRGEHYALLGGNGVGKTTLLKLLTGLYPPNDGTIICNETVGFLPQDPRTLFVKKSVREDLLSVLPARLPADEKEERLQRVCTLCEIGRLTHRHPFDLSGGEAQRAALAKILLIRPSVLLLDEPTKGMDAAFKLQFARILRRLQGKESEKNASSDSVRHTILTVSHDIEFCAEHADTVGLFFDGVITASGTPSHIFSENRIYTTAVSRMVKSFLPHTVTVNGVLQAFGKDCTSEPLSAPATDTGSDFSTEPLSSPETDTGSDPSSRKESDIGVTRRRKAGMQPPRRSSLPPKAKKKPSNTLPAWRKWIAAFLALISVAVFFYATTETDISGNVTRSGITYSGKKELIVYGILIVALLGLCLCLNRFSERRTIPPSQKRKLTKRAKFSCLIVLLCIPLTVFIGVFYLGIDHYLILSFLLLAECLLPFFIVFEGRRPQAKEIVVIAVLCGLCIAGRTAFFMLSQFKPVLALTILSGVALGGETGFMVGAVSMLASNMLFGNGPWTPWQMFAMGLIGFLAGILFQKGWLRRSTLSFCLFGAFSAIVLYGGILNPASVLIWSPESFGWESVLASYLTGFPMDLIQAAATILFLALFAEPMLEKLDRIKTKYGILES